MEYLRSIHYISQVLLEDVENTTGMLSNLLFSYDGETVDILALGGPQSWRSAAFQHGHYH